LGIERAVVLGLLGAQAMLFAATHPKRTQAVVLVHPNARVRAAHDYPEGLSDEVAEQVLAIAQRRWGTGWVITRFAPSMTGDERFVRWCARCERLSVPP